MILLALDKIADLNTSLGWTSTLFSVPRVASDFKSYGVSEFDTHPVVPKFPPALSNTCLTSAAVLFLLSVEASTITVSYTHLVVLAVIPTTLLDNVPSSETTPTNIVNTIPKNHIMLDWKNLDSFPI